ncbi:endocuticle structural glycoprotein SgAbd-2-like [Venturia canescens]|uniref:endocuticle structural glycoprotein SgAbd-2-like n=1 Tax=Venturia canescens TaxID=32260 RepID=UPI001C9BCC56|nr:endocuticle structural glycoprotein SgAbd-2-like [Venturia canescens]
MCKIFVLLGLVAVAAAGVLPNEPVPIVHQEQDISPDGSFHTKYETGNGISYQEQGVLKNPGQENEALSVQGSSSYNAPDGTPIQLTFVADENGFQPQGAHLPVAPPAPEIPAAILRALEYIAAHPYVEPSKKRV